MDVTRRLVGAFIIALFAVGVIEANVDIHQNNSPSKHRAKHLLADTPSLRLHVMLKAKSMRIHGQSVFEIFAKPAVSVDGAGILYNGFATFVQDDKRFTYMLVDGASYVVESVGNATTSAATQTVRCLKSLTPFDSIISALNTVQAIPSSLVNDEAIYCPSGTLLQTSTPFGGVDFTFCASARLGFIAYGGDITVAIEYPESPLQIIAAPPLNDGSTHCATVASATSVTPIAFALLTGDSDASTCPYHEGC
ncbi:unnamed protein product [Phytophthora fragariaefolia]|uniref:Unnamed protein product n=1 Tax=Phytophthora fragariaefolia TaxID=1490495 RepID=A0A9W6Y7H0_9STRA|nr:unnamed protein product [Phytophthora fragariaefolia]